MFYGDLQTGNSMDVIITIRVIPLMTDNTRLFDFKFEYAKHITISEVLTRKQFSKISLQNY